MLSDAPSNSNRRQLRRSSLLLLGALLLLINACSFGVPAPSPTPVVVTVIVTAASQTPAAKASATTTPVASTGTPTAACTVLQDVNLRNGPGTAYNPPITSLKAGTELRPTGFNPVGVPNGTWLQVDVTGQNEKGWVSVGTQFISCNIELASLQPVNVAPPPTPQRPIVSAGAPDGNNLENFRISLDFNPDYLLHVYVFYTEDPNEKFKANKDGHDIDSVEFTITSPNGDKQYYDSTENNPGYCIFGGGEPDCNPWIVEDGQYKWKQGGGPVKSGKYGLTINVTATNGEVGTWLWNSNSHNPITIDVP